MNIRRYLDTFVVYSLPELTLLLSLNRKTLPW